MDDQGGGADAFDTDTDVVEEEAQVLNHVVAGGVANLGATLEQSSSHQHIFGHRVATLGQGHPYLVVGYRGDFGPITALGGLDAQPEVPKGLQMRGDRTGTQIAAAGIGQLEVLLGMQQRPQEHDDRTGAPGGVGINGVQVEVVGSDQLQLAFVLRPDCAHPDAGQHFQDSVDLLDLRNTAQDRPAPVQQRGAQQCHRRVLRGANGDGAM